MNNVNLIGRLTREPELRETLSHNKTCYVCLAVRGSGKNVDGSQETYYFDCIAWHKLAENIATYAHKGDRLSITGILTQRSYIRKDGSKGSAVEVVISSFDFLEAKKEDNQPKDDFSDIKSDDLPF